MNVRELREALARFPDDLPVWHDGGGDPYLASEVLRAEVIRSADFNGRVLGHEQDTPEEWLELS
jgi:hypothetical protein